MVGKNNIVYLCQENGRENNIVYLCQENGREK